MTWYIIIYKSILDGILVTLLLECELYENYALPSKNELYTFMEFVGHKIKMFCMVV